MSKGKIDKFYREFNVNTRSSQKNYSLNVYSNYNKINKYGKVALTPLAVSADAILTAAGIGGGFVILSTSANVDKFTSYKGIKTDFFSKNLENVGTRLITKTIISQFKNLKVLIKDTFIEKKPDANDR